MKYVDGFVIPIQKKSLKAYRKMAQAAGKVWREHGALEFFECVGEDLAVKSGCGLPFPKLTKLKRGETVLFSFIVYKSRAHRDKVNAKVMKDKRIKEMCGPDSMPFDVGRMAYGGFEAIVEA